MNNYIILVTLGLGVISLSKFSVNLIFYKENLGLKNTLLLIVSVLLITFLLIYKNVLQEVGENMSTELNNTFVVRTDDKEFEVALSSFLSEYCLKNNVNAAYFNLNEEGSKKVMEVVKA